MVTWHARKEGSHGWDPHCGCSVKPCVSEWKVQSAFEDFVLTLRLPWLEEQGWRVTGSAEVMMLWEQMRWMRRAKSSVLLGAPTVS